MSEASWAVSCYNQPDTLESEPSREQICRRPNHPQAFWELLASLLMSLQETLVTENTRWTPELLQPLLKTLTGPKVSESAWFLRDSLQCGSFSAFKRSALSVQTVSSLSTVGANLCFNLLKFGMSGSFFFLILACLRRRCSSCC